MRELCREGGKDASWNESNFLPHFSLRENVSLPERIFRHARVDLCKPGMKFVSATLMTLFSSARGTSVSKGEREERSTPLLCL